MIGAMEASSSDIYEAVLTLSRSIAGHTDLESLLAGVAESLRRVVGFDYLALVLHDADQNATDGYILCAPAAVTSLRLPVDEDPAGWVWLNQQPLVISRSRSRNSLAGVRRPRSSRVWVSYQLLVPLTAGENRLGAFGFSSGRRSSPVRTR